MQCNSKSKWAGQISRNEWVSRVEAIADLALRTKVASIVWWDHFSSDVNGKPSGLDKYVKTWAAISKGESVAPSALYDALVAIGYPQEVATKRSDDGNRYGRTGDAGKVYDLSQLRGVGPESLLYAVIEDAVVDVKHLNQQGVIVEGKVHQSWPPKGSNGVIGYGHKSEVTELINFFYSGDVAKLAAGLGTTLRMEEVRVAVGLDDPEEIAQ